MSKDKLRKVLYWTDSGDDPFIIGSRQYYKSEKKEIIVGTAKNIYFVFENVTIPLGSKGRSRYGNGRLKSWHYSYNEAVSAVNPGTTSPLISKNYSETYTKRYANSNSTIYFNAQSNSYNYLNSNENLSKSVLFYDITVNAMRECSGSVINGSCSSFAPYNRNAYDLNTLFYNPSTGAMQKCLNNTMGSCRNFAPQPFVRSKDQLYYNPRTRGMSKCLNANMQGRCLSFGMAPSLRLGQNNSAKTSNPYSFSVPSTPGALMQRGSDLLNGRCQVGNCR